MSIWQLLSSFPTVVPTVLLVILLIYWLLSIAGVIDIGDNLELDLHHDVGDVHHEPGDLSTLAGYLVALGLGGAPFSIVVTLLVFFTWLATALVHQYLIAYMPTTIIQALLGVGTLIVAAALSIPVSSRLIKPMRPLFVKHQARSNRSLVGLSCKILTQTVDEKFGRAEVSDNGASINIRVWARSPNPLTKNCFAIVLNYDENTQQYEVQASPDSL